LIDFLDHTINECVERLQGVSDTGFRGLVNG
jgi:hypothetical protein